MADHRHKTVEKRLGLPNKEEERELFAKFELYDLMERYSPLADFILDDYACPNENTSIVVEEMLHNALLMSLIRYRKKDRHLGDGTFTFFFTLLAGDIMKDYVEQGMAYKIAVSKVMGKE